jgi:MoxR-like ATPase
MDLGFTPQYFDPARAGREDKALLTVTVRGTAGSYVYSPQIILAVNLALASRRPLFVAGRPGTGKTTLARNVAHVLGRRYYQRVITSRTRARDLMWQFDSLRRLSDAQERDKPLPPRAFYVQPQVLWWAFDPASAAQRGAAAHELSKVPPAADPALAGTGAVVLLDEIDKADPDVPNDLLEALDVARFTVDELDTPLEVRGDPAAVLVMITSNGERELPPAFLRRCVVLTLDDPTADWLVTIANDRFGAGNAAFHRQIADQVLRLRDAARAADLREPSTAEYLDAIAACRELGIDAKAPSWSLVAGALLWKRESPALPAQD